MSALTVSRALCLLVDRWAPRGPTATLYWEPKGEVYRVLSAVKFGDPLKLPDPFDVTIDTSEFPVDRPSPQHRRHHHQHRHRQYRRQQDRLSGQDLADLVAARVREQVLGRR